MGLDGAGREAQPSGDGAAGLAGGDAGKDLALARVADAKAGDLDLQLRTL